MPDKNIPNQYLLIKIGRVWPLGMPSSRRMKMFARPSANSVRFVGDAAATSISFALEAYTPSYQRQLPTNVPQLQPYFAWINVSPVPDLNPAAIAAILQRYQMLKTGTVSDLQANEMVLTEKAPVDDKFDYIYEIGLTALRCMAIGDRRVNPTGGTEEYCNSLTVNDLTLSQTKPIRRLTEHAQINLSSSRMG